MDSSDLASRRTRSQVAPKWTGKEALILANQIAAVETDYSEALSSYQKWEIVSENCNALDVPRNSNQCKRKWDSLLEDYHKIKKWESCSKGGSYCSLGIEKRKALRLPLDLDNELFEAIKAAVVVQEDKAGTEPDSDPEAKADTDMLEVITKPGPKRSRKRPSNRNEERPQEQREAAKCGKIRVVEKLLETSTDEEAAAMSNVEETDALAAKLRHNAQLIHEIVNAKEDHSGTAEDSQAEFVRRQGDRLIACFEETVSTFHRFSQFAKGWE